MSTGLARRARCASSGNRHGAGLGRACRSRALQDRRRARPRPTRLDIGAMRVLDSRGDAIGARGVFSASADAGRARWRRARQVFEQRDPCCRHLLLNPAMRGRGRLSEIRLRLQSTAPADQPERAGSSRAPFGPTRLTLCPAEYLDGAWPFESGRPSIGESDVPRCMSMAWHVANPAAGAPAVHLAVIRCHPAVRSAPAAAPARVRRGAGARLARAGAFSRRRRCARRPPIQQLFHLNGVHTGHRSTLSISSRTPPAGTSYGKIMRSSMDAGLRYHSPETHPADPGAGRHLLCRPQRSARSTERAVRFMPRAVVWARSWRGEDAMPGTGEVMRDPRRRASARSAEFAEAWRELGARLPCAENGRERKSPTSLRPSNWSG